MTSLPKCAQLQTFFATGDSTYTNINMRTVVGEKNFELGAKYNLVLRAQMNDVGALPAHHRADRLLLSSNMMRFQNYETAVNKQASAMQAVTYASFPIFYGTNTTTHFQILNNSCIYTFTMESEMGFVRVQSQTMANNTQNGQIYPNYFLLFDIYKCS
jgi:hypothetical protein